jgi:hypothetical protein
MGNKKENRKRKKIIIQDRGFSDVFEAKNNEISFRETVNNCKGGTCPSEPINNCAKGVNCIPYCGIG